VGNGTGLDDAKKKTLLNIPGLKILFPLPSSPKPIAIPTTLPRLPMRNKKIKRKLD
jgi:hypothetical protein